MTALEISVLSTQNIYVPVSATTATGVPLNPSGCPVQLAFPVSGSEPQTGNWVTATWATMTGGAHNAYLLVGPSGFTLNAGSFDVWVKVTATPEIPVIFAGTITVS